MSTPSPIHPSPHIILPSSPHTHTLILLHGTSTPAQKFAKGFLEFSFDLPSSLEIKTTLEKELLPGGCLQGIKVVFPSGTLKPIGALDGKEGTAWFNVHDFKDRTKGEEDQVVGMSESVTYLKGVIEREVEEIGKGNVVIGGFSQGSAMGMVGVLSGEWEGLGGFWGLSGWLAFRRQILEIMSEREEEEKRKRAVGYLRGLLGLEERGVDLDPRMPMLLGHGDADTKVRYEWGLQKRDALREMGIEFTEKTYPGVEHGYCEQQMRDLVHFLQEVWKLNKSE